MKLIYLFRLQSSYSSCITIFCLFGYFSNDELLNFGRKRASWRDQVEDVKSQNPSQSNKDRLQMPFSNGWCSGSSSIARGSYSRPVGNLIWLVSVFMHLDTWLSMLDYISLFIVQLLKPDIENARAMLQVICMLDSEPTRLSEGSIAGLGDSLPFYLLNVVHVSTLLVSISFFVLPNREHIFLCF